MSIPPFIILHVRIEGGRGRQNKWRNRETSVWSGLPRNTKGFVHVQAKSTNREINGGNGKIGKQFPDLQTPKREKINGGNHPVIYAARPKPLDSHMNYSEFLNQNLFAIMGGFIAGGVGLLFHNITLSIDARRNFRVKISQLRGRASRERDLEIFYKETFADLESAVFGVRQFLKKRNIAAFDQDWKWYGQLNPSELGPDPYRRIDEIVAKAFGLPPETDPKKLLQTYFDRFERWAEVT